MLRVYGTASLFQTAEFSMAQFNKKQKQWSDNFLKLHSERPQPGPLGGNAPMPARNPTGPPPPPSKMPLQDLLQAIRDRDEFLAQHLIAQMKASKLSLDDKVGDWTPLTQAVQSQLEPIAQLLLTEGANVDKPGPRDSTPLHIAVEIALRDRKTQLRDIILKKNPKVDVKDADGKTPLMIAAAGDFGSVELLLKRKATIDLQDNYKSTALQIASANDKYAIVELLLTEGADPNIVNDMGQNALMQAAWNKADQKIASLLLAAKKPIDVNAKDKFGRTALILAAKEKNSSFIDELIKNGKNLDVNLCDNEGDTALIVAAKYADAITVKAILQSGKVKIDMPNKDQRTALLVAAFADKRPADIFPAILAAGPNVNWRDVDGNTALHLAVKKTNQDAVKALLGANAKTDIKNTSNLTALDEAMASLPANHPIITALKPVSPQPAPAKAKP
jgi:ankyrin repeat protein